MRKTIEYIVCTILPVTGLALMVVIGVAFAMWGMFWAVDWYFTVLPWPLEGWE